MNYKKSAVILLFNNMGQLALQKRAENDKSYPLHWDFSAAGGIDKGETTEAAALRELKEELGLEATVIFIGEELYEDENGQDGLYIYKSYNNGPFNPDPKEVEEVYFFKLLDIQKMLDSGVKFHPEFSFVWNKGIISKIYK